MKLFLMAASVKQASVNKKLINLTEKLLRDKPVTLDKADFREFDVPLYDADVNESSGLPAGAKKLIERMHAADGLIWSVPEYNFSMPGTLKNLIDWVSRDPALPWKNQFMLLLSASPSLVGGNRGLWSVRVPLECCGAFIYPDMFSLANAYQAFDDKGGLIDATLEKRLDALLDSFLVWLKK